MVTVTVAGAETALEGSRTVNVNVSAPTKLSGGAYTNAPFA